jgi:hypothetical protein
MLIANYWPKWHVKIFINLNKPSFLWRSHWGIIPNWQGSFDWAGPRSGISQLQPLAITLTILLANYWRNFHVKIFINLDNRSISVLAKLDCAGQTSQNLRFFDWPGPIRGLGHSQPLAISLPTLLAYYRRKRHVERFINLDKPSILERSHLRSH